MAFYFSKPEKLKSRTGLSGGWKVVGLNDLKPEDKLKLGCPVEWDGSYWKNPSGSILLWIPEEEKKQKDEEKEKIVDFREKAIEEKLEKEGFKKNKK